MKLSSLNELQKNVINSQRPPMTAAEKLHQLIQTLPEEQITEVLHFAESLHQRPHTAPPNRIPSGTLTNLRGLLKTDQPAPTDQDVDRLLQERRIEKYLRG